MALNFPEKYHFRLKKVQDTPHIFCPQRKKWFVLTPEEWVRQHVLCYLHRDLNYKMSSIHLEAKVRINQLNQRVDILVYQKGKPYILCECKRPTVALSQEVLNQSMRYNQILTARYIMLSNGLQHLFFDTQENIKTIEKLPTQI